MSDQGPGMMPPQPPAGHMSQPPGTPPVGQQPAHQLEPRVDDLLHPDRLREPGRADPGRRLHELAPAEEAERLERLDRAIETLRADPPELDVEA